MLVGLLKTIIFLLAIYYIGKFLLRIWLKSKVNEHIKRQKNSVQEDEAAYKKQEKGKVTVHKTDHDSGSKDSAGEYVDYEEIKD